MTSPTINVTVEVMPAPTIQVTLEPEPVIQVTVEETAVGPKGDKGDQGIQGNIGPQGIQGPIGQVAPVATFTQAVPSSVWLFTHTITYRKPLVITLNLSNEEIIGDVSYPAPDQVQVDFAYPQTGYLQLI